MLSMHGCQYVFYHLPHSCVMHHTQLHCRWCAALTGMCDDEYGTQVNTCIVSMPLLMLLIMHTAVPPSAPTLLVCHLQCEEEWDQTEPVCVSGFATSRNAAEAALRYEPVGTFVVRMCAEPGCFAISCRISTDAQDMHMGNSDDGYAPRGMLVMKLIAPDTQLVPADWVRVSCKVFSFCGLMAHYLA